jgi:hypothetical protein
MYEVRERGTDKLMGTYKSRTRARNRVDALDNAYGCYHYYVREVIAK